MYWEPPRIVKFFPIPPDGACRRIPCNIELVTLSLSETISVPRQNYSCNIPVSLCFVYVEDWFAPSFLGLHGSLRVDEVVCLSCRPYWAILLLCYYLVCEHARIIGEQFLYSINFCIFVGEFQYSATGKITFMLIFWNKWLK